MSKMTSTAALQFVTRIETLKKQISEVYSEVCDEHGAVEINAIREIVAAREAARDRTAEAEDLLAALDLEDDEL